MIGGGLGDWEQGEWNDDTQLAVCIAEAAAIGNLASKAIAERFLDWYRGRAGRRGRRDHRRAGRG